MYTLIDEIIEPFFFEEKLSHFLAPISGQTDIN
jgi:hypothetical protein